MEFRCAILITALALVCAGGCVSRTGPGAELHRNEALKRELRARQQDVIDAQEQNRERLREQRNLSKSVLQMESVVAHIRDPARHQILVPPTAGVQVLEVVLDRAFDGEQGPSPSGGELVDMPDGRKALRVIVDPAETKRDRRVVFPLPTARLVGAKLRCTVLAKGEKISKPPVHWGGGKFQLMVKTSGKTQWPAASIGGGTFDWKQLSFAYDVPYDAHSISLMLGLEKVSGTIYFRDLRVESVEE